MIDNRPTAPLRAEHRALLPEIDQIRSVADGVGTLDSDTTLLDLSRLGRFFITHLIPHAHAEEEVLYPEVARRLGAPMATATMTADHGQILSLIAEIDRLRAEAASLGIAPPVAAALRGALYGLHAILRLHFAKEEEHYLPLLDSALTAHEADALFERLEASAARAGASSDDPTA